MERQVLVGKVSDDMEKLKQLCSKEAEQLVKTITRNEVVTFWTADFPELICVAQFNKGMDGQMTYELDFSQATI